MSSAISLSQLCEGIVAITPEWDQPISSIHIDSRQVKAGGLFLAFPGQASDGRDYIQQAFDKGAVAVLCEQQGYQPKPSKQPIIAVTNLAMQAGYIASHFYGEPSHAMKVIGVTGTNGKTSITLFIAQALQHAGIACGVISTIGNGMVNALQSSDYTTPDCIAIQQQLAELKQQGAKAVVVETSSHGLSQGRTNGIAYDIAIFTNLTRDHLDYHGDMQNYGQAKRKLFTSPGVRYGIINADDDFGQHLLQEFSAQYPVYGYSISPAQGLGALIKAKQIELSNHGIDAHIDSPWGQGELNSSLLGQFNVSNLLAVLSCLQVLGLELVDSLRAIKHIQGVCGRMETFRKPNMPLVAVDFAHTPDALQQALLAAKAHCQGELICVFGCGGGRDKGKRPMMAQVAEALADKLIVTSDNPRQEQPKQIIEDILAGINDPKHTQVEADRLKAIHLALSLAGDKDIVVIAGKGHEQYQQIGEVKHPFSDQQVVKDYFAQA